MSVDRLRDANWEPGENGKVPTWERVIVAILLDIRDRLDVLRCPDFKDIPRRLSAIENEIRRNRRRCHKRHVKGKR